MPTAATTAPATLPAIVPPDGFDDPAAVLVEVSTEVVLGIEL